MTGLKQRLAKVEVSRAARQFKPALSFIWASPDDDAALEAAHRQAEAEDRILFVCSIYPPFQPGEAPGIKTGLQPHG